MLHTTRSIGSKRAVRNAVCSRVALKDRLQNAPFASSSRIWRARAICDWGSVLARRVAERWFRTHGLRAQHTQCEQRRRSERPAHLDVSLVRVKALREVVVDSVERAGPRVKGCAWGRRRSSRNTPGMEIDFIGNLNRLQRVRGMASLKLQLAGMATEHRVIGYRTWAICPTFWYIHVINMKYWICGLFVRDSSHKRMK